MVYSTQSALHGDFSWSTDKCWQRLIRQIWKKMNSWRNKTLILGYVFVASSTFHPYIHSELYYKMSPVLCGQLLLHKTIGHQWRFDYSKIWRTTLLVDHWRMSTNCPLKVGCLKQVLLESSDVKWQLNIDTCNAFIWHCKEKMRWVEKARLGIETAMLQENGQIYDITSDNVGF